MSSGAPADLRGMDGLLALLRGSGPVFEAGLEGVEVARRLHDVLGVPPATPVTPVEGDRWRADGVDGVELSWNVGFGPDTRAWLLRPAGEDGEIPGVVGLHCHGGAKFFGKEKIADGPRGPEPDVLAFRESGFGGVAIANELARRGYAVLVHDVFGWGSRRFGVEVMPARSENVAELTLAQARRSGVVLSESQEYDHHAGPHEDAIAKTLGILGTSWGGVVAREDLIAVDVLTTSAGVARGGVAVVGLSGGGARAAMATALASDPGRVRAAAIASMMTTMDEALDGYVHGHTWMMMNPGLGRVADWPDIAAAARPRPLFVGYTLQDALFPVAGMRAAHEAISARYAEAGAREEYRGVFVDAPHSLDLTMQAQLWPWLDGVMRSG